MHLAPTFAPTFRDPTSDSHEIWRSMARDSGQHQRPPADRFTDRQAHAERWIEALGPPTSRCVSPGDAHPRVRRAHGRASPRAPSGPPFVALEDVGSLASTGGTRPVLAALLAD